MYFRRLGKRGKSRYLQELLEPTKIEHVEIEHKLLRIPTVGRLASWLFTQRGRGVELGTTENKYPESCRVKDLNQDH